MQLVTIVVLVVLVLLVLLAEVVGWLLVEIGLALLLSDELTLVSARLSVISCSDILASDVS